MKKVPEKRKIVDLLLISRLGTFVFSFSWPFRKNRFFHTKKKLKLIFTNTGILSQKTTITQRLKLTPISEERWTILSLSLRSSVSPRKMTKWMCPPMMRTVILSLSLRSSLSPRKMTKWMSTPLTMTRLLKSHRTIFFYCGRFMV